MFILNLGLYQEAFASYLVWGNRRVYASNENLLLLGMIIPGVVCNPLNLAIPKS